MHGDSTVHEIRVKSYTLFILKEWRTHQTPYHYMEVGIHYLVFSLVVCRLSWYIQSWGYGWGLRCLTPLSIIFQLYLGCQFYRWRKPGCPENTIDHWQVTDKLSSIMVCGIHLVWAELINTVVIGTDCKSNNHAITTTTTLGQYTLCYSFCTSYVSID